MMSWPEFIQDRHDDEDDDDDEAQLAEGLSNTLPFLPVSHCFG